MRFALLAAAALASHTGFAGYAGAQVATSTEPDAVDLRDKQRLAELYQYLSEVEPEVDALSDEASLAAAILDRALPVSNSHPAGVAAPRDSGLEKPPVDAKSDTPQQARAAQRSSTAFTAKQP